MVSNVQLKIIGTAGLVFGLLILLWGILMLSKQWLATGFVAIVIAVTLLYYGKRMEELEKRKADKPAVPPRR